MSAPGLPAYTLIAHMAIAGAVRAKRPLAWGAP
jgi:hypothetical protein